MLRGAFICRHSGIWRDLYVSSVRLDLEYRVQVWNPYLERYVSKIDSRELLKFCTDLVS